MMTPLRALIGLLAVTLVISHLNDWRASQSGFWAVIDRVTPSPWGPSDHINRLALGTDSAITGSIKIPIEPLQDFDGWSRFSVAKLRREMTLRHKELLSVPYEPSQRIFGQIESGKPWWGIIGEEFYFRIDNSKSSEGPSEESRMILNPFVLVWPYIPAYWTGMPLKNERHKVSNDDLYRSDFPLFLMPTEIEYHPRDRSARLAVPMSDYTKRLAAYSSIMRDPPWSVPTWYSYNAADLGLPFFRLSGEESKGISLRCGEAGAKVAQSKSYLHIGPSCTQPGGCNNASGSNGETGCSPRIDKLPATMVFHLWPHAPKENEPPALKYSIDFN